MDFAQIKAMSRRAVHDTLAVPCLYSGPGGIAQVCVTARLHTKLMVGGAESQGYATIIEGVTKVVFNREELALAGVTLRANGKVAFPDYGVTLRLDERDPYNGPVTEKWSAAPQ